MNLITWVLFIIAIIALVIFVILAYCLDDAIKDNKRLREHVLNQKRELDKITGELKALKMRVHGTEQPFAMLQRAVHMNAQKHGWWDEPRTCAEIIALCHSELSEALEEYRKGKNPTEIYRKCGKKTPKECLFAAISTCEKCDGGKPEGIPTELADCVIRIMDYCEHEGIDLYAAIVEKHKYNISRPFKHGGKMI